MASNVKVNGTWKSTATVYTKVNGTWKTVTDAYTKVNGTWKQWLAPAPSYYTAPVYYATPPSYYAAPVYYATPAYYAGGGGTTYYTVPDLTYLTVSAAILQITGNGNTYGGNTVTQESGNSAIDGWVYNQSPAAGSYTSPQTVSVYSYHYVPPPPAKTVVSDKIDDFEKKRFDINK